MKRAETCSCSLYNKLYTYLYHHVVVLDKYVHSNLVYCLTVTEYKYIPYEWNTILPDSRKTVVYDTSYVTFVLSCLRMVQLGSQLYGIFMKLDIGGIFRKSVKKI